MAGKEGANKEITISQVQAEIEQMLEQARIQAKRIVEDALGVKEAKKRKSADHQERVRRENAYLEEYVPIELFKDNGAYKNDVFVSVNGENCLIQRGKPVLVKRKFAQVLDASKRQDMITAELSEKLAGEYEQIKDAF